MPKIAAIQMNSNENLDQNLKVATQQIEQAAKAGAELVVLPEMFSCVSKQEEVKLTIQEHMGKGKIQETLAGTAHANNVWIVGGTTPIACDNPNKFRAACLVFDNKGNQVARYDKMHLFNVTLSKEEIYRESDLVESGNQITIIDTPIGKLGLAVCYDIRFPEMFRDMFLKGVEVFAIPAAFSVTTGQAHWELFTRTRAVESFSYIIGACQGGTHPGNRMTHGHSIIVDPWGTVMAELADGVGFILADIDLDYLYKIRKAIPVDQHYS